MTNSFNPEPFERVTLVDVDMVGNQYRAKASHYNRNCVTLEMTLISAGPPVGNADVMADVVRAALIHSQGYHKKSDRLFINANS